VGTWFRVAKYVKNNKLNKYMEFLIGIQCYSNRLGLNQASKYLCQIQSNNKCLTSSYFKIPSNMNIEVSNNFSITLSPMPCSSSLETNNEL
jgi:hypothetical protein